MPAFSPFPPPPPNTLVLGSGGQPAVRIVTPDAASAPEDPSMMPRISYDISESYLWGSLAPAGHPADGTNTDTTTDTTNTPDNTTSSTTTSTNSTTYSTTPYSSDVTATYSSDNTADSSHVSTSYPVDVISGYSTSHPMDSYYPTTSSSVAADHTARQRVHAIHDTPSTRPTYPSTLPYRLMITYPTTTTTSRTSHHYPTATSTLPRPSTVSSTIPYSITTAPHHPTTTPVSYHSRTAPTHHAPVTSTFSNPSHFSFSTMNVDSSPDDRYYETRRSNPRISASLTSLTGFSRRPHYHHHQDFW